MTSDQLNQLERLAVLRGQGALSEEEYQRQKGALLGSPPPVPPPPPPIMVAPPPAKKKSGGLLWIGILFMFFAIFSLLSGSGNSKDEPKTRQEVIESFFSPWDGSHMELESQVKKSLNDPDSYEHVETTYLDHGQTITLFMKFRGTNAFGGKVVNTATATIDGNDGHLVTWDIVK